jgi:hypothetical protein
MHPFGDEKEFERPPQSFEELDEWAVRTSNGIVHNAVSSFHAGLRTKEEALLLAVYHLAKQNAEQHRMLVDKAMREPMTMIVPAGQFME